MPINCEPGFGIMKPQRNHHSAVGFNQEVDGYFKKGVKSQELMGPFEAPPIEDLCFSPIMSVPKEDCKRRIIVDFSFPPGKAINDGISKATYLDFAVTFSLPSVNSMVIRLNELGRRCLMYKRDLKGAFRQFGIDPGDYRLTGLSWSNSIFFDTRLAMGLRSSAFCCQSVTELVAKIARKRAFVLVYLDDFGGAEPADKAFASFDQVQSWAISVWRKLRKRLSLPRQRWTGLAFALIRWIGQCLLDQANCRSSCYCCQNYWATKGSRK